MRSLGGLLRPRNDAPVPIASRSRYVMPSPLGVGGREAQMAAMGSVGTLFSIVNRTSGDTSRVPWKLWRKAASGKPEDRTEVTQHLALKLWDNPNPFMSGQEWREVGQQHLDLTGESWTVITRVARTNIPAELWPIRPDRMEPIADPAKFIVGYLYTSPDGEKIPLRVEDVIFIRMPNPLDMYRGMGPVQSILTRLDSARYSAEWNRNFFRNSAQPGGIIQFENTLSDTEFDQFQERWNESHRGVANAHRVALIERGGQWVDRKMTHDDMQFSELDRVDREVIREAFGIHGHMLGMSESVNRANADAAEVTYQRHLIIPRLSRWAGAANGEYLRAFGAAGESVEFDHENPVPEDPEGERAERKNKAETAKIYIDAGWPGDKIAEALELPELLRTTWEKPEPPAPLTPPGAVPGQAPKEPAKVKPTKNRIVNELPSTDLTPVQQSWQEALDQLAIEYAGVTAAQRAELQVQIEQAVAAGDLAALTALTASSGAGAALIAAAMYALALSAGRQVVAEAAEQGVTTAAAILAASTLAPVAAVVAATLARSYAASAGREALRLYAPGTRSAAEVAHGAVETLAAAGDATARGQLGGALTMAQNSARLATLRIAPLASYFASEELDRNTCGPCKELHGTEFDDLEQADKTYGEGMGTGYWGCKGWPKCRGTVVASWNEAVA
jgi:HK97 family phage portal protein